MRFSTVAIMAALMTAWVAGPAPAEDPLAATVDARALTRLRAGESLKASFGEEGSLTLMPAVEPAVAIAEETRTRKPSVGAELLTILPARGAALDTPSGMLALSNALLAVSTMKGVTYWSVTHGRQMPLFLRSFAIESPERTDPRPDPVITEIPGRRDLVTLQEDSSFGTNTYAEQFTASSAYLHLKTENLSTISFLLVPLISPHGMVSHVIVVPTASDVLFYGMALLNSNVPLGNRESRVQSLQNRLTAMAGWVSARISTVRTAPSAP